MIQRVAAGSLTQVQAGAIYTSLETNQTPETEQVLRESRKALQSDLGQGMSLGQGQGQGQGRAQGMNKGAGQYKWRWLRQRNSVK